VSGVRDPNDFPQTPGVEGIKALSQGLGDKLHDLKNPLVGARISALSLILAKL